MNDFTNISANISQSELINIVFFLSIDEWKTYLLYVRNLDFFETPDYNYLYKLFMGVMERNGWVCDWVFDWTDKQTVCLKIEYCLSICYVFC